MGLQAAGTGGFIVLAVTMDIKYVDEEDSPDTIYIAINTFFGIPVACFCFLFAGAAFFNVFHKASSKKNLASLPSLSTPKSKIEITTVPTFMAQDVQSMV
ncbi:conserved hypothetical protein [Ricinus communis]|uniref:Uncharacterized protein n=1 Tax=Ricinus communis TaxID=3988 RepID=B9SZU1_RICCO|nr:conserved hypothetical protein [Ricinus communis]